MTGETQFFRFARERQKVLLAKRDNKKPPWTKDKVLQDFYFCNIFREDDKTTAWFRENIRDPLRDDWRMVTLATVAFRWFNFIPTGELIKDVLLRKGWDARMIRSRLKGQGKIFTGAYIIMPRPGVGGFTKLEMVCQVMGAFKPVPDLRGNTLQMAHHLLTKYPGMGPFYAYEVISDLRYTCVLEDATDIDAWANPGPGCKRGLIHVFGKQNNKDAQIYMDQLLRMSRSPQYWPRKWPRWDMRTVEHTLCEYDKYVRGWNNKRLKRKYNASHHK